MLLPSNRTPWESAIEGTNAARYPLPVDLITATWSPDDCPVNLLPYLAWAMSVDVWDKDWPETTKREAIRKSLAMHRLKTTPAGIKQFVALAGAEVKRIIRPPARAFMRTGMTDAMRAAWLDSLPQIRIYPFANKLIPKSRRFFTGPLNHRQFFDGKVWARTSRGLNEYGRRATFYDAGVETPVSWTGLDGSVIERITIATGKNPRSFFGHSFLGRAFAQTTNAPANVYTLRFSDALQTFAVDGSIEPVDVRPQRIAQQRTAPTGRMYFGRHGFGHHMRASAGPMLIYDRISINEPNRTAARRHASAWYGHGRFGINPYTAEIKISVPMRRSRRRGARWMGVGFLKAPDMSPLTKAIETVRAAKAFRDTILIDTTNYGRATFGGDLRFGDFTFGQILEVR